MTIRAVSGGWIKNGRGSAGGASLSLNFLNGITDYRITYSGGTNGTRVNSAGVIVNATAPRFDYNPATLAARGLLREEARTNLLLRSEEFTNATWVGNGVPGGTPTRTANTNTAPNGSLVADTITDSDAVNRVGIAQSAVVPDDSLTRVLSYFLLKTSGATSFPGIQMQYTGGATITAAVTVNTNDGTLTDRTTFAPLDKGVEDFGAYWRVWISFANNTSGSTTCVGYLYPAVNADASGTWVATATGSVIVWGAQLETGNLPSSYIPTTTATETRDADVATMTGANFSSWYNQTEGTFVVSANIPQPLSNSAAAISADNGTSGERIQIRHTAGGPAWSCIVVDGGATQANLTGLATGSAVTVAAAYAVNNFAACANGGTVSTDASGTLPTPTQLQIGNGAGVIAANGWIESIQYYPRRMSNEQLQVITV